MDTRQRAALRLLAEEVGRDSRVQRFRKDFAQQHPDWLPYDALKPEIGIGAVLAFEIVERGAGLGLAGLPNPGWFFLRALLKGTAKLDQPSGHDRLRLQEEVRWFYRHFVRQESVAQIALDVGFSTSTIQQALTRVRKLIGVAPQRGRPSNRHRPSQTL